MHCMAAKAIWFSSPLGIHVPSNVNFMEWMNQMLLKEDQFLVHLFGITLWRLWQGRNLVIFKSAKFDSVQTVQSAVLLVKEFNSLNRSVVSQLSTPGVSRWIPPVLGSIKINVDVGCLSDGSTGWGFIARNHSGNVLFSGTRKELTEVSPLMSECWELGGVLCGQWSRIFPT